LLPLTSLLVNSSMQAGEAFMGIQKFDRSKWSDVCAAISIALLGKRAEIEVVSPDDGLLIGAQWLPMIGIVFDPVNDELKSCWTRRSFVFQPREMYFDFGFGGVQSLGILDNQNAWQIVLLRDPVMAAASGGDRLMRVKATVRRLGYGRAGSGGSVKSAGKHE